MIATPENTAVVTIMAYPDDAKVPTTCNFMLASAKRLGIKVIPFRRGEIYHYNDKEIDASFDNKIRRLRPCIEALPYQYKYILYVDARDVLFVRSLEDICVEFNSIGWPILMSSERICHHHVDPGWHARFGKHASGYDYNNAGCWMAERDSVMKAFATLETLSTAVKEDKISSSFPGLWSNDQHLWQTAYVEHSFPLRLDFEQKIFNSFQQTRFEEYDYSKSEDYAPMVLLNGSRPGVIHFAGHKSIALPYVAWLLNIVPPGTIPKLDYGDS